MQEEDEEADLEVHVPGKGSVVVSVRTTQQTRLVYQVRASKFILQTSTSVLSISQPLFYVSFLNYFFNQL